MMLLQAGFAGLILQATPGATPTSPTPDMLPAYIRAKARAYVAQLRREVEGLRSAADWQRLRARLLKAYRRSIGPLPKRTPLNAMITGRLRRPGVIIEKVVFESRPRFYVTGNLYLPSPAPTPRVPAVLLLSGHFEGGKADPASPHQRLAFSLAHLGVATFAIDPLGQGERKFTPDAEREPTESCVTEHCSLGYPCLLTGTNLIQYMVWDGMRAIDYLATRREIDASRMAVTGISGGGTQTFSLAPLDRRIGLAAPTCFVTSRLAFLNQAADAEQCLFGAIRDGLDHSMLIALCAPRRYQVQATRSDLFPIQGARDSVALAQKVYALYKARSNLTLAEDDGGHDYTRRLREAFYEAASRSIGAATAADEPAFDPIAPTELACTPTGYVKTSFARSRWVRDFNRERADEIQPRRKVPHDPAQLAAFQRDVRMAMRRVLGREAAAHRPGRMAASRQGSCEADGVLTERFWVETEPGITVVCMVARRPCHGRRPAVVLLGDGNEAPSGKALPAVQALRATLISQGWVVVDVAPRGTGPSAVSPPAQTVWERLVGGEAVIVQDLSMCGTSLFAGRTLDTLRCVDWLLSRRDIDRNRLSVVGWGQGGLIALTVAALDRRLTKCGVVGGLASYRLLVDADRFSHPPSTFLWNVLGNYDLPEAAACVAPRPLLISFPVDGMGVPQSASVVRRTYRVAEAAYRVSHAPSALALEGRDVASWLGQDAPTVRKRSP